MRHIILLPAILIGCSSNIETTNKSLCEYWEEQGKSGACSESPPEHEHDGGMRADAEPTEPPTSSNFDSGEGFGSDGGKGSPDAKAPNSPDSGQVVGDGGNNTGDGATGDDDGGMATDAGVDGGDNTLDGGSDSNDSGNTNLPDQITVKCEPIASKKFDYWVRATRTATQIRYAALLNDPRQPKSYHVNRYHENEMQDCVNSAPIEDCHLIEPAPETHPADEFHCGGGVIDQPPQNDGWKYCSTDNISLDYFMKEGTYPSFINRDYEYSQYYDFQQIKNLSDHNIGRLCDHLYIDNDGNEITRNGWAHSITFKF